MYKKLLRDLGVFHYANLGRLGNELAAIPVFVRGANAIKHFASFTRRSLVTHPDNPSIEYETLLYCSEDRAIILPFYGGHEIRLM